MNNNFKLYIQYILSIIELIYLHIHTYTFKKECVCFTNNFHNVKKKIDWDEN